MATELAEQETDEATETTVAPSKGERLAAAFEEHGGGGEPPAAPPADAQVDEGAETATEVVTESGDGAQPVAETPAAPSLIETLSELGFENLSDESEAQRRVVDAYRQQQQRITQFEQQQRQIEHDQALAREYIQLQQNEDFRRFQEQQRGGSQATQQPGQADAAEKSWWAPPTVDTGAVQQFRQQIIGEDGEPTWAWKADTPAELRSQAEKYQQYLAQWDHDLHTNPEPRLTEIVNHIIKPLREEFDALKAEKQQTFEDQFANEFFEANPWMFETDPVSGQIDQNKPNSLFDEVNQYAISLGGSPQHYEAAAKLIRLERGIQTQQQQATPADAAADKKKQIVRRNAGGGGADRLPPAGGTIPPETNPTARSQNPDLTAGQKLAAHLQQTLGSADGIDFR